MRFPAEHVRSPSVSRLTLCAALALATAGCSGDTNRFEQPFSNPFSSQPPATTGSVNGYRPQANHVDRQPLPQHQQPYQSQPYQPQPQYQPQAQYQAQPQYQTPAYQPAAPQYQPAPPAQPAAYHPPQRQDVTGSVPRPAAPAQPQANRQWDWNGGTPVTVGQGETIQTMSRRYGVPAIAIAEANGMSTGTPIYPGQRLVIPKYANGAGATASRPAPPPPVVRQTAQPQSLPAPAFTGSVRNTPASGGRNQVHVVAPGETLYAIGRRYQVSPLAIANANNLPPHHMVRMGERLTIPGGSASQTASPAVAPRPAPVAAAAQARPQPAPQPRMAEIQTPATNSARVVTPAADNPVAEPRNAEPAAAPESTASASPGFRWPARGRVIAGFGPKPTGQQNDGINLAVPEGTPVKASDDGVVAYAGNELKGYGNLVLVRHANGYVTAYAHASELMVKRGDSVKRGQTIARSGQTGNVSSPQLHFEIRKGATPVDPMQYLTGAS